MKVHMKFTRFLVFDVRMCSSASLRAPPRTCCATGAQARLASPRPRNSGPSWTRERRIKDADAKKHQRCGKSSKKMNMPGKCGWQAPTNK